MKLPRLAKTNVPINAPRPMEDKMYPSPLASTSNISLEKTGIRLCVNGIIKIEGTRAKRTKARVVFSLTTYRIPSIKSSANE